MEDEVELAIDYFQAMTAFDALECLCLVMNAGEAEVNLNGAYTCKIKDMLDVPQIYEGELAREVPVTFYGGPPNSCERFVGNLLMLLVDHFLFNFVLNKTDKVEKALSYV